MLQTAIRHSYPAFAFSRSYGARAGSVREYTRMLIKAALYTDRREYFLFPLETIKTS